ncbi:hypothetical protein HanXRQr2_Chr03g0102761 [Helianthus annuus]|uniref:Uncharacterized protein n=1 Tax=Helianthus annuus TaxID=4232 RepID=A0A9K3JF14_HELAN|nr:hypothetical protein HanXRQr2_Chr03g0102761 [Helianthus annuus]
MKRPYGRPVAYTWCTYCFFANKPVNNRPRAPHPPADMIEQTFYCKKKLIDVFQLLIRASRTALFVYR